jgi:hypothetical protein
MSTIAVCRIKLLLVLVLIAAIAGRADASGTVEIRVMAGDTDALIAAVREANSSNNTVLISVYESPDAAHEFVFTRPAEGSDSALPVTE